MGKVKISDIATELGYESKEVIEKAKEMGLSRIKTASNVVTDEEAAAIYVYIKTGENTLKKVEKPKVKSADGEKSAPKKTKTTTKKDEKSESKTKSHAKSSTKTTKTTKTTTKTTGSSATSTTAPKTTKANITFKSDGNTRGLDYFVNNYPSKQRGEARTYLKQMQDSFPQVARSVGIPTNDLSSGLAAAIAGAYMAYNNVSLNDNYMKPMAKQFKEALESVTEFDKMSDSDKKYIYDQMVIIGMTLAVSQSENQQNPNAKTTAQLRQAGKKVLEGLLGVSASKVRITASGLSY